MRAGDRDLVGSIVKNRNEEFRQNVMSCRETVGSSHSRRLFNELIDSERRSK